MRLGEHSVHTWDVAVALDPAATVDARAVDVLVDQIGPTAAWSAKPAGETFAVVLRTTEPSAPSSSTSPTP